MLTVDDVLRMAKAAGVTVRVEGYDLVLEHGVDSPVDVLLMLRRYKPELVSAPRMREAIERSLRPPEAVAKATDAHGAGRDAALLQAMSENPDGSMQDWANASGQSKRAVQTALEGRLRKRRLVENRSGNGGSSTKAARPSWRSRKAPPVRQMQHSQMFSSRTVGTVI
jgi:hypothetical protein